MTEHARPVVVGVDDTEESLQAVRWATAEAVSRDRPLRLVYAFDELYATEWRWQTEHVLAALREGADEIIATALVAARAHAGVPPMGVAVTGEVVVGHHTSVLTKESERAALLVLGSRRLGTTRSLLGSVSGAVSARAVCPVAVVRGTSEEPAPGQHVIVGVDPRDQAHSHSDHVLSFAFDYADRHDLPLRAVVCWRPYPVARGTGSDYGMGTAVEGYTDRLQQMMSTWSARFPGVRVDQQVLEGRPAEVLVRASDGENLLVVGARGHSAVAGTLLGSVSQGVLHHANCAVAVVHRPPSS